MKFVSLTCMCIVLFSAASVSAQQIPSDYQQVLTTLGKQGDFKDQVLKVNIPRNDVQVTVAGVATPTPSGFGGWISMSPPCTITSSSMNRACSTCMFTVMAVLPI